jgi:S1-C subfamily serine protease
MKNIKQQASGWIIVLWLMGLLTYHWGLSSIENSQQFKRESRTHDFMLNNLIEVEGSSGVMVHWDDKAKVGYVLTCAHVVRGHDTVHIVINNDQGEPYEEEICPVVNVDTEHDLALVLVKRRMPLFTVMSDLDFKLYVKKGMTVWAAGYPTEDTQGQMLTVGHIVSSNYSYFCSFCENHHVISGIFHDATIWYGCSGGPLVDPQSGKMVGLNFRLGPGFRSNRAMAISAPTINQYLRQAGIK